MIGGTTLHPGFETNHETKLLGFNEKSNVVSRLSEVKFFIIDELAIVSSDLWTDIDSRLGEIFMIPGLSVMTVADLLQQPTVRGKFIFLGFSKDSKKYLIGLQLWHLFQ